jgi:hypothetical protein
MTSTLQIKRAISSWIHKFADTAEKALVTEFTHRGLQTQEERAAFVQRLLGDADDMSDKKCPFIWESAYDDCSSRHEVTFGFSGVLPGGQFSGSQFFQGIFQGRLVARTFLEHIQIINTVDAEHRVQEKPTGALIYSIQAVGFYFVCGFCPNLYLVSGASRPHLFRDWDS